MRGALAVVLGISLIVLWSIWTALDKFLEKFGITRSYSDLGLWGDSFGALNALMSALGFSAVFYTLLMQQKQIKTTETDQHKQRFESSFFELLRFLRETSDRAYYIDPGTFRPEGVELPPTHTGSKSFRGYWNDIRYSLQHLEPALDGSTAAIVYGMAMDEKYTTVLDPYYDLLSAILQRIDNDKILLQTEKSDYVRILLTQLDSYETAFFAIRAAAASNDSNSAIVLQYDMLDNIPSDTYCGDALRRIYGLKPPRLAEDRYFPRDY